MLRWSFAAVNAQSHLQRGFSFPFFCFFFFSFPLAGGGRKPQSRLLKTQRHKTRQKGRLFGSPLSSPTAARQKGAPQRAQLTRSHPLALVEEFKRRSPPERAFFGLWHLPVPAPPPRCLLQCLQKPQRPGPGLFQRRGSPAATQELQAQVDLGPRSAFQALREPGRAAWC